MTFLTTINKKPAFIVAFIDVMSTVFIVKVFISIVAVSTQMHCLGITCTKSFYMGLTCAEKQKLAFIKKI
jgi:hypothetical protein